MKLLQLRSYPNPVLTHSDFVVRIILEINKVFP